MHQGELVAIVVAASEGDGIRYSLTDQSLAALRKRIKAVAIRREQFISNGEITNLGEREKVREFVVKLLAGMSSKRLKEDFGVVVEFSDSDLP